MVGAVPALKYYFPGIQIDARSNRHWSDGEAAVERAGDTLRRAVVLSSGSRPTLIRTVPWMTGPHADAVTASIAAHDPKAERTIREAQSELAAVEAALSTEGAPS